MSIHGNRSLQNNFLLDGVDNNSISTNVQELTTQVSRPSIDAIEEFKIQKSMYAAEFEMSGSMPASPQRKAAPSSATSSSRAYGSEPNGAAWFLSKPGRASRLVWPVAWVSSWKSVE